LGSAGETLNVSVPIALLIVTGVNGVIATCVLKVDDGTALTAVIFTGCIEYPPVTDIPPENVIGIMIPM
jgi:hypothetical protein